MARNLSKLATAFLFAGAAVSLGACSGTSTSYGGGFDGVPLAELDTGAAKISALSLSGIDTVIITEGPTLDIAVENDPDNAVRFRFEGDSLEIGRETGSWSSGDAAIIRVTMPAPRALDMSGSGRIETATMAPDASIAMSGSSTMQVANFAAKTLDVDISGSGQLAGQGTAQAAGPVAIGVEQCRFQQPGRGYGVDRGVWLRHGHAGSARTGCGERFGIGRHPHHGHRTMCSQRIGFGHRVLPLGQCQRYYDGRDGELTIHAPASGCDDRSMDMAILAHRVAPLIGACALLGGCIGTLVDVAKAPFEVAGKAVDLATTSQSESDEKRGRALRERYEQLGKLDREYGEAQEDCADGNRRACERAQRLYAEMQVLMPSVPASPRD